MQDSSSPFDHFSFRKKPIKNIYIEIELKQRSKEAKKQRSKEAKKQRSSLNQTNDHIDVQVYVQIRKTRHSLQT